MIVQINLCQVFYVSFYCFLDKVLYKGKKIIDVKKFHFTNSSFDPSLTNYFKNININ